MKMHSDYTFGSHYFQPFSIIFPYPQGGETQNLNWYIENENINHSTIQKERNKEMKASLHLYRLHTIQLNFASLIAFFVKLISRLPRLMGPADDPAALRYIANKYNGEGD
jgi:hypothetical protein